VTDQAKLERRYRRLLAWYPRSFRRENGEEILAVLMACAADGQRRPGLAERADLMRSGLWMRLCPSMPRYAPAVRAAVRLMYVGAAISAVNLLLTLTFIWQIKATQRVLGVELSAAQADSVNAAFITVAVLSDLIPVVLWLWLARAIGRGRTWARSLSGVLLGLATVNLTGALGTPGIRLEFVAASLGPTLPVLWWLVGLVAVWLLWRPGSTAYFKPEGRDPGGPSAQPPEHRSSSAQFLRPF
jgi:hypothetical protein